jgi:excisionase family DNA binding protein
MADIADVMDVKEAAALLRVHPNTLYAEAAAGRIPCRKVGRQYRFTRPALERWLEGQDEEDDNVFSLRSLSPTRSRTTHLH